MNTVSMFYKFTLVLTTKAIAKILKECYPLLLKTLRFESLIAFLNLEHLIPITGPKNTTPIIMDMSGHPAASVKLVCPQSPFLKLQETNLRHQWEHITLFSPEMTAAPQPGPSVIAQKVGSCAQVPQMNWCTRYHRAHRRWQEQGGMAKVMSLKQSFEGDAAFFLQSIILKHMAFFIVLVAVIYRTCYLSITDVLGGSMRTEVQETSQLAILLSKCYCGTVTACLLNFKLPVWYHCKI